MTVNKHARVNFEPHFQQTQRTWLLPQWQCQNPTYYLETARIECHWLSHPETAHSFLCVVGRPSSKGRRNAGIQALQTQSKSTRQTTHSNLVALRLRGVNYGNIQINARKISTITWSVFEFGEQSKCYKEIVVVHSGVCEDPDVASGSVLANCGTGNHRRQSD